MEDLERLTSSNSVKLVPLRHRSASDSLTRKIILRRRDLFIAGGRGYSPLTSPENVHFKHVLVVSDVFIITIMTLWTKVVDVSIRMSGS